MERNNVYIGMRYVPKFVGEWDSTMQTVYESLSIVIYNRNTYTSKKPVPVNIPLSNTEYWVMTGFYDGQVARLQDLIDALDVRTSSLENALSTITTRITALENTVQSNTIRISDLENTVQSDEVNIASNTNRITSLETVVSNIHSTEYEFFNNKNILIMGDSNSTENNNHNWVSVLREKFPTAHITNHSFNGALLTGQGAAGQANWYATEAASNFDYIIVMLGTNDCYQQAAIDYLSYDNKNVDTFTGSLSLLASKFVEKNPTARVFYISPIKNTQMQSEETVRNNILDVYRTLIWRACDLYSWTFIDAGHCAPLLNPLTYPTYIPDGVHMSDNYAPIFADYVINKMVSGGDAGCGSFSTTHVLTQVLNRETYPNATLDVLYKSDGSVSLQLLMPNTSIGAGIALVPTTALPKWCSVYGTLLGNCMTGNPNDPPMPCEIVGSEIHLFPTVTETTDLKATFTITSPFSLYPLANIF
jgi:lysophospholipase L1-like esterase